ncbi:MAG: hypothetical protein EP329_18900, partial [Deltaproteobacteria bacterium]
MKIQNLFLLPVVGWLMLSSVAAHAADPAECKKIQDQLTSQPGHMHTQMRIDDGYAKGCPALDQAFWKKYTPSSAKKGCDELKRQLTTQPGHM